MLASRQEAHCGLEESSVLSRILYAACVTPYTEKQIETIDKMQARVLKESLKVSLSTSGPTSRALCETCSHLSQNAMAHLVLDGR